MPELPEVQTVVSDLQEQLVGDRLLDLKVCDQKVWFESEVEFPIFKGKVLKKVHRRSKYLIFDFGDLFIAQHLRMTGTLLPSGSIHLSQPLEEYIGLDPKIRAVFKFEKAGDYVFWDIRRFGTLTSFTDLEDFVAKKRLAPESLTDGYLKPNRELAFAHFSSRLKRGNQPIKTVLLDQSVMSGVGNIYADEALHLSKINPFKPAKELSDEQARLLYDSAVKVMELAVQKRGTSASDYLDLNGQPGVFAKYLQVYKRVNQTCKTCDSEVINRAKIAGRSSHYCNNCQI